MAALSDQHDLSGLEGVLGPLSRARVLGSGGELRQGRSLPGRRPAQRQAWLGRHNSIRLSDKGASQSQDLGWGMRVELSRGWIWVRGFRGKYLLYGNSATENHIKTTLSYKSSTNWFYFLICGEKILKWCEHVSRGADAKSYLEQHFALELCS